MSVIVRHHQIRDDHVEASLSDQFYRLAGVRHLCNTVLVLKCFCQHRKDIAIVVDQKNRACCRRVGNALFGFRFIVLPEQIRLRGGGRFISRCFLRIGLLFGKYHREFRAFVDLAFQGDAPVMHLYELFHECQPYAVAAANFLAALRSDEWLENRALQLVYDAYAVVGH